MKWYWNKFYPESWEDAGVIILPFIMLLFLSAFFNYKSESAPVISPIPDIREIPTPMPTPTIYYRVRRGLASYYSRDGCLGCSETLTMANGEPLDDNRLTVAYNDAPINSFVRVRNVKTEQMIRAKVTDTGGFKRHGKIIDLTIATRDAIGCGPVCEVEVIL